jgi:hypothetical protein
VIRILVLIGAALLLAGCNDGNSATTARHGGYSGRAASLYDTARSTCKHQLGAGASASKLGKVTGHLIVLLDPHDGTQAAAIGDGCAAGFGLPAGYSSPLYETTTSGP